ncbi:enolase C-terminal domain-like protein [Agromyces sp. Leaf222]|uniref:enolase C-terminal domain-like protein n=1 Tax=Agromyces sp. Leaf222 TaxID=1735688 RepID=UPI0006FBC667|nr:enolase C-terminal domain-like protein [Agromyces sp. Leaf222]KQM82459.1 fuconate dehydratase [Agromyces sp. Leaf222]
MGAAFSYLTSEIRFGSPSRLDGADASSRDSVCSAAYLTISDDATDGREGHGFVPTAGGGADVQLAAIDAAMAIVEQQDLDTLLADMGATWRALVDHSQRGWLAPDGGVAHRAAGAVVNALWDLKAKRAGVPLWRLLAAMRPAELVGLIDFRYLSDALAPQEALAILDGAEAHRFERERRLLAEGYPAAAAWPGALRCSDEHLERLCRQALASGFTQVKLEVGASLADDLRRLAIAREVCGPDIAIAVDAGHRWGVDQAVAWISALSAFDLHWVEDPTSPVDLLGHAAIAHAITPVPIATGEHALSPVMVKQLLQLNAIGYLQIDGTAVNENIATLLLAAGTGVPVCSRAGGAGLSEVVQHLAMFDFVAVSGSMEGRAIEYVDRHHEHFVTPAQVHGGRYRAPFAPGSGAEMLPASLLDHMWPILSALDGVA